MCMVPDMADFCGSFILCFPGRLLCSGLNFFVGGVVVGGVVF
jgi:hypothetical protein